MDPPNAQNQPSTASSASDLTSLSPTLVSSSEVTLVSSDGSSTTLTGFKGEINAQNAAHVKALSDLHYTRRMRMQARQMSASFRSRTGNDESAVDLSHDLEYSDDLTTDDDERDFRIRPKLKRLDPNETDNSEFLEHCDLDSDNTRELLRHYLENSDSVDDLKLYKLEPAKYLRQIIKHLMDLFHFIVLVFTSKQFWNTCLMIANILAAVFFYLVLAVSTIIVTLILSVHDGLMSSEQERHRLSKKETQLELFSKLPDIDELST